MKRDPRLIAFSREHHRALKLGNDLTKVESVEAGNGMLDEHRQLLLEHFLEEEQDLSEMIEQLDEPVRWQFLQDHHDLRLLLQQAQLSVDDLHYFGQRLIAHTRFEERELFQLIQQLWASSETEKGG